MIRISLNNLKNQEKDYLLYFKDTVSKILHSDKLIKDNNLFITDMLINPFNSDITILKEYFLTAKLIIDTESTFPHNLTGLFTDYVKNISSDSVFNKIINSKKNTIETLPLLQQFISNRQDAKNSKGKKYTLLEDELKKIIPTDYNSYKNIRLFLLKIKKLYDSKKFNDYKIELIDKMDVTVCPYCNRQYIDIFKRFKYKDRIAIAQLDHFYPRSLFPLYSISLYNLVPSCAKCNSLKSNNVSSYIYPYIEENKAKEENTKPYFELKFDNYEQLIGLGKPIIGLASKDKKILKNAQALFHEELYQNHSDFAQRLLNIKKLDNKEYIKSINKYFKDYKLTREDLYGFSGSTEELLKKPLSKLAHDIIDFDKK